MALMHRPNSEGTPTLWRDVLGWDPFPNFYSGASQFHGLEIARTENGYTVELPVAGFKPDQIDVTLDHNVLTVSGKGDKRQFTRSLLLPEEIDAETIQANVEDGLLTLVLSFHPKAQPRKINVQYGTKKLPNA